MGTLEPRKNSKMSIFWKLCILTIILQAVTVSGNSPQSKFDVHKLQLDDTLDIDKDPNEVQYRTTRKLDAESLAEDELQPLVKENGHESQNSGWLVNGLHRVRRELSRLFGVTPVKAHTKGLQKRNEVPNLLKKVHEKRDLIKSLKNVKSKRQSLEYFGSGDSAEGGAEDSFEFWQTQIIINEPWTEAYRNRSSTAFLTLNKTLESEITDVFLTTHGDDDYVIKVMLVNVIPTQDIYKIYVVVHLQLSAQVRNFGTTLFDHIRRYQKLNDHGADVDKTCYFYAVRDIYNESTATPSIRTSTVHETKIFIDPTLTSPSNRAYEYDKDSSPEVTNPYDCDAKPDGWFLCKNGGYVKCIERCDNLVNCPDDGSDEEGCNQDIDNNIEDPTAPICSDGEFHCTSGEKIPCDRLCNKVPECKSGSDEWSDICVEGNATEQTVPQTEENNQNEVPQVEENTHEVEEASGSDIDENSLDSWTTSAFVPGCNSDRTFTCNDRSVICEEQYCDGTGNCADGEDELYCQNQNGTPYEKVCMEIEFKCDNRCLPLYYRCNGNTECNDQTDEINCPPRVCHDHEFRCKSGDCIPGNKRCNQQPDCPDGDDEDSSCQSTRHTREDCTNDQFFCDDYCHPISIYCNNILQCSDHSDEENCMRYEYTTRSSPVYPCPEHTCSNGHCYSYSQHCDGKRDCDDGEDEYKCCTANQFRCRNGECIPAHLHCNRVNNCQDGSDEEDCPDPAYNVGRCTATQFRCDNGQCVNAVTKCDGTADCQDSSDETRCTYIQPTVAPQLMLKTYPDKQIIKESNEVIFRCRDEGPLRANVRWSRLDGRPLPVGAVDINGRLEIPNIRVDDSGSYICEAVAYPRHIPGQQVAVQLTVQRYNQLVENVGYPSKACQSIQATCMNGECIDKSQICDGIPHCSDGSDEHSCSRGRKCHPNQFMCENSKCVDRTWRCDGENDCGDNTDEQSCDPLPSDAPCRYDEFQCRSGHCIPKSFQCDGTTDCQDTSDEIGCMSPVVQLPPPPLRDLVAGSSLNLTCIAKGVPVPEVVWRLNWGHVPEKCESKSYAGTGTLFCPNMQYADSGAYSCEVLNTKGTTFATPDTLVTVQVPPQTDVCPSGFFNMLARSREECITCFCFGITKNCRSADLFNYAIQPQILSQRVVNVVLSPYRNISIRERPHSQLTHLHHGVQFRASNVVAQSSGEVPYLALPSDYMGNQLKSYGGSLRYDINFVGSGRLTESPDVILTGNGYTLVHNARTLHQANIKNHMDVQFMNGEWFRPDGRMATREELMMVLANVENILLLLSYIDTVEREIEITNILMDTAGLINQNLRSASFVEHCSCPPGYVGYSCESCAPGYVRENAGAWLGRCIPAQTDLCPPGKYSDPQRNMYCHDCPCPGTNNFANGCQLTPNNDVICNCNIGYAGRRCEYCASGYEGNPLIPGGKCSLIPESNCNLEGTLMKHPNGTCICKPLVEGELCDRCAAQSYHLNSFTYNGCIECFCNGITKECSSSHWYRAQIVTIFGENRQPHEFQLIRDIDTDSPSDVPTTIRENTLYFSAQSISEPLYWSLPAPYLGDKVTSYGGKINYTLKYNPLPSGSMSRNNAPDVVIKSTDGLTLIHFRKTVVSPSKFISYGVPIIENVWQGLDGLMVNREHMLRALSKIKAIYIKATYTTRTLDGSLSHISLDYASPNDISTEYALEVEECRCPAEYDGPSCERCAEGYKPALTSNTNSHFCEPCKCHNHSNQCNPETGICYNCAHNTQGNYCERCAEGYIGNATDGTPYDCSHETSYYPTQSPADTSYNQNYCTYCNQAGTISCDNGNCQCKSNVYDVRCNTCRPGTYDLSEHDEQGCKECYCSGLSQQCRSSNLYRHDIPLDFFDKPILITNEEGYQLESADRLNFNVDSNSIEYNNTTYETLYWSLRGALLGNQLKSYGGDLKYSLEVDSFGEYYPGIDVVLIGNGMKLLWSRPENEQDNRDYRVRLHEDQNWQTFYHAYAKHASRQDIMKVLSNLEHLLIRATTKRPTTRTIIRDVTLESAIESPTLEGRLATEIEICTCPVGYIGNTCETCAPLYYRNENNQCQPCPCQDDTTQECNWNTGGYVECRCKNGYSGDRCQYDYSYPVTPAPTTPLPEYDYKTEIKVLITKPQITIIPIGGTLTLSCTGYFVFNQWPVVVTWYKLNGQLPQNYELNGGELTLHDLQIYDSGVYRCRAINNQTARIFEDEVAITITEESQRQAPQIIDLPEIVTFDEQQPNEIDCQVSGNPPPQVIWARVQGQMSNEVQTEGSRLIFHSPRVTDSAFYRCFVRNEIDSAEGYTELVVRPAPVGPQQPQRDLVYIDPSEYSGESGQLIRLTCNATSASPLTYEWNKDGSSVYHQPNAFVSGNVLKIQNSTSRDSGIYTCTATDTISHHNYIANVQVYVYDVVTPHPAGSPPVLRTSPAVTTIIQGTDYNITCEVSGNPHSPIKWTKVFDVMADNVHPLDNVLQIINARSENRGMYVCLAPTGDHSTVIEIEARELPFVEVQPLEPQVLYVGDEASLYCRGLGIPKPSVKWVRLDGQPISSRIREIETGILTIPHVELRDTADYECIAENVVGQNRGVISIRVIESPVIHLEPDVEILRLREGNNVKIICAATGTPSPHVQWVSDNNAPVSVTSLPPYTATLELFRVTRTDSKTYKCIATSEAGISERYITLDISPTWDANRGDAPDDGDYDPQHEDPQPLNVYRANIGEEVRISCDLENPKDLNEEIRSKWDRVDGQAVARDVLIDGHTLIIPSAEEQHAGSYRCLGFNASGTIVGAVIAELQLLPIPHITFHPKIPIVVTTGENVEIYCEVTGEQPIQVSWHAQNNRPLPASVLIVGQYLRFYSITPADAGHYYCSASNRYGNATESAEVKVNRGASYTQPQSRHYEINQGEDVQLQCDISQLHESIRRPIRYNWRREDGRPLPSSANAINPVLYLNDVRLQDAGRYICEISSIDRTFAPSYADLSIKPNLPQLSEYFSTTTAASPISTQQPREPTLKLDRQHSKLHVGQSTEVECYASDGSYSDIVWERADGLPLPPNIQQIQNRLVVSAATPFDGGSYICKCRTDTGHFYTTNFQLEVEPIKLDFKQPSNVHVNVGDDVNLPCEHNVPHENSLGYKWTRTYGQIQANSEIYNSYLQLRTVQANDAGSYVCTVTTPDGANHESITTLVVTGAIPQFNQDPTSYLVFPKLSESNVRFNFEISFRPKEPNGLLLFNGEKHGSGDYIALSLSNGYPEFRFDFDGKPLLIRAEQPISMHDWHTIRVNRFRRDGYMQVDEQHPVPLPTLSQVLRLDLVDDLYIGGIPNWDILPQNAVEHLANFVGCISRLTLQGTTVNLMKEAKFKAGITSCEPCAESPCEENGICLESQTEIGYTCTCQPGWTGRNCGIAGTQCTTGVCGSGRCENTDFGITCLCPLNTTGDRCQYVEHLNAHSLAFRSNGYAAYDPPSASKLNIKFQVRPNTLEDSILLYTSESKQPIGDYVAVVLRNEHVELMINMGARLNPVIVRSLNPLPINKWTEIETSRRGVEHILRVGNEAEQKGRANGLGRSLYIKTPLYVGGYDYENVKINRDINITRGFDGCIANLSGAKRNIHLIANIVDAANVQNCGETNEVDESNTRSKIYEVKSSNELATLSCATDPCENNGTCYLQNEQLHCNCLIGFAGRYCEDHITLENKVKFQGNGYIELNRNQFSVSVDQKYTSAVVIFSTTAPDGLLLWWGQNRSEEFQGQDFIALAIVNGIIECFLRLNGEETVIRNHHKRVDDGARHIVVIKRTDNTGMLEMDHVVDAGETRPTGTYTMHLPGHVFIGGAPNIEKFTGRYTKNFTGCIYGVEGEASGNIQLQNSAVSGINVDVCPKTDDDNGIVPPVV